MALEIFAIVILGKFFIKSAGEVNAITFGPIIVIYGATRVPLCKKIECLRWHV
jgi:hypothetical protein